MGAPDDDDGGRAREPALAFVGATVQRVDVGRAVAVLRVRSRGCTAFVLVAAAPGARGVGVIERKPFPGGTLPDRLSTDETLRWRKRLEGGLIVGATARGVLVEVSGKRFTVTPSAARVELRALDDEERETQEDVERAPPERRSSDPDEWSPDALRQRGERMARALGEGTVATRRETLVHAVTRAIQRIERRADAVRGDLERIDQARATAAHAAAFVAEAARAPRGARTLAVTDWSTGEPRTLELAIDPSRSAQEQLEATFRRARRMKQGAIIAGERLAEAERTRASLAEIRAALERAASADTDLDKLEADARRIAPRDLKLTGEATKRAGRRPDQPLPPFRTFHAAAGDRILVGRGAAHNDTLTLRVARPHDLWLHAKNRTGAHVVVPLEKGHTANPDLLVDAAHLAAHFSDARSESTVEIQHTPRRYLRKPRGSAPGLVVVDREKVLVLRVEAGRIQRLLASEVAPAPTKPSRRE